MRHWVEKFETGEYLREFRGYSPFWAGCFYGNSVCLGGEEEFSHCYDFFSGIGDVEWWISSELDKLTDDQKDKLEFLMERNKNFDEHIRNREKIEALSKYFGIETYVLYRMGNLDLYDIFKCLNDIYNNKVKKHTRVIENSINFGEFDSFIKEEFEVIQKEPKKVCDLFNYNETIKFALEL